MSQIDLDTLRKLTDRLRSIFEEYDVQLDRFYFSVNVTQGYYDRCKHNFSDRSPSDICFTVRKGNGHIQVTRSAFDLSNPPRILQTIDWQALTAQVIPASMREQVSQFHEIEPELGDLDIYHRNILKWTHSDGEHVVVLPQGKAVIQEEVKEGVTLYNARIEDKEGNVVSRYGDGYLDFESANLYVHLNLTELDQVGVDDKAFREKLATALDTGISHFASARPTQVIHRWPSSEFDTVPSEDWENYAFDWQKQDNRYYCQTPHGKAIIAEVLLDDEATYSILVEDETGVMLRDYYPPLPDFPSAVARMCEVLTNLDDPFVDEITVEHLSFTLRICARLLPPDTNPMVFIRLCYVDNWLAEALP